MKALRTLLEASLDLLWPPRCSACGIPIDTGAKDPVTRAFCPVCEESLVPVIAPRCPLCSIPFAGAGRDHVCGHCAKSPPPFEGGLAAFEYGGALKRAVIRLKYHGLPWLARGLGLLLSDRLRRPPLPARGCAVVVPVASHPTRLRERGCNPAALLARPVARALALPLDTGTLRRRADDGRRQASLGREARLKSLEGAFFTKGQGVAGRSVLLVDDVVTTTATVRAASLALLEGGADSVSFAALARST